MRKILLSTLMILSFLTPPGAHAQAIAGFASIPWGASRADIEEEWGPPARVDELETLSMLRYPAPDLAWPETIRGWQMAFGVRNDRLLSGRHVGVFERQQIAEEAHRMIFEELKGMYSLNTPRACPEEYREARYCRIYANSAIGDPEMEQISGSWRTLMFLIDQQYGDWALTIEYMTGAEKAAAAAAEDRRY
ncbi:MAG: hypothetical protein M8863_07405 [marine benthic group bacterium]|nr:hypothetical protein [Gemmatimonadota bacterium]